MTLNDFVFYFVFFCCLISISLLVIEGFRRERRVYFVMALSIVALFLYYVSELP